jgi:hypothetical protein
MDLLGGEVDPIYSRRVALQKKVKPPEYTTSKQKIIHPRSLRFRPSILCGMALQSEATLAVTIFCLNSSIDGTKSI